MKKIILSLFALFLFMAISEAQTKPDNYCGYRGKSEWLTKYQQNPDAYPKRKSGTITYLPIAVHIVGTDEGTGHFAPRQTLDALCTLNQDMADSEIQFYLEDPFNYINNTEWYSYEEYRVGNRMMRENNIDGAVNCYINEDPVVGNCGYYTYGADAIALKKGCLGINDHTWAHEIGHLLSLPHPFLGWEGEGVNGAVKAPTQVNGSEVEILDRSFGNRNCNTAGDGFCDTYPDYLSSRWSCNSNGESGELTDPNGEKFRADGTLFMSYANDACSNRFSSDQINAMHSNILDERQDLLNNPTPLAPIDIEDGIKAITPSAGEAVPLGEVLISWEPVKNATHYYVEVSLFPNLANPVDRKIVTTTELLTSPLTFERPHFWRIRPFNNFQFCEGTSEIFTFEVTTASSTKTIEAIESFVVAPVPAASGSDLLVQLTSDRSISLNASLISLTGQVLKTENIDLTSGAQNFKFGLPTIANGVYILSLQNEKGERVIKKVVVN